MSESPTTRSADVCRACGGPTCAAFESLVLGRHRVEYLRCRNCDSLQTEPPYWLSESYTAAIAATDTGAMVRNLVCHAAVCIIASVCAVRGKLLDWGGGVGVLCRLLRDRGFDAYLSDRYAEPVLAQAFRVSPDECPAGSFALVSAMEVLEHYDDPAAEIARLFALQPQVVVATTETYSGQGQDWWYLAPQTGQHVFFYSRKCLRWLAHKHGYNYFGVRSIHLFSARALRRSQRVLLRIFLSNIGLGLMRIWLAASLRGRFANLDSESVCRQLAAQPPDRSR